MKRYVIVVTSLMMVIIMMTGCQSKEDKALLEQVKARESAKTQLIQTPSNYIIPGTWDRFDKGIINTYTKATSIQFTNNSIFDVDEITGTMTYADDNGKMMAEVPFTATGTIRAGQSLKLPVTAGEISGKAKKAIIKVERVHIIGQ
jgi:hypothetical protein